MSKDFADDPRIRDVLSGYAPVEEATVMKGFDDPVPFVRLTADDLTAKRRAARAGSDQRS